MSTICSYWRSDVYHGQAHAATRECTPGNTGHAHSADTSLRACSWSPDRQAHSTNHERFPSDAARLALSRASSAGKKRMGRLQMGNDSRPKTGTQVLPVDLEEPKTAYSPRNAIEGE